MVELEHNKTATLGNIITIKKDGEYVGRLRQIGNTHSDVRLEWLTWDNHKAIEHAIQFPCCSLLDVTQNEVERMVTKFNL